MSVSDALFIIGMLLVAAGLWLAVGVWLAAVWLGLVMMVMGVIGARRESERPGGERGSEQGVGRAAPERPKPIGTSERRA